jgi:hypothetical protein
MGRHTVIEEGFSPRSHLRPLLTDPHSPHACPTPGVYTFTVTQTVLRLLNLPCLGLQQQTRLEVSELCGSYRTPSRSSHFLRALSHLERVAHRLGNLPLQPQPPPSPGESVTHRPDNLFPSTRFPTQSGNHEAQHEHTLASKPHTVKHCVATIVHWETQTWASQNW